MKCHEFPDKRTHLSSCWRDQIWLWQSLWVQLSDCRSHKGCKNVLSCTKSLQGVEWNHTVLVKGPKSFNKNRKKWKRYKENLWTKEISQIHQIFLNGHDWTILLSRDTCLGDTTWLGNTRWGSSDYEMLMMVPFGRREGLVIAMGHMEGSELWRASL